METVPITKPRKGILAILLSLFTPGLGQFYNGQPKKGIFFFVISYIVPAIFLLTNLNTSFWGFLILMFALGGIQLWLMFDAFIHAKMQSEYRPMWYNKWYYYLLIAILMMGISYFVNGGSGTYGVESYQVSGGSQSPTLEENDRVIADLRVYDDEEPNYGDIVTFNRPDGEVWIFRVVGLPNDQIDIIDNSVVINGRQAHTVFIRDTSFFDIPVKEFEEILPNGHKYHIYKFPYSRDKTKATMRGITVPLNSYYVLGDNRDNAMDSRFIGPIKKSDITGKLLFTFWGSTTDRINIDFRDK